MLVICAQDVVCSAQELVFWQHHDAAKGAPQTPMASASENEVPVATTGGLMLKEFFGFFGRISK
jgi:hypothetical protein